jgi:site-specific DNA-cytosine methylase
MLKVTSLFSGIGGIDLGLEATGYYKTTLFSEIDPFCQKILKKHWPNVPIIPDVRDINGKEIETDVLVGGFPCQPFSVAGKRKGKEDERHLWPEMFRIIKEARPSIVIGENVPGIINVQMALGQCVSDLEGEGYKVQPVVLPACSVNAPHRRYRVFIIAMVDTDNLRFPQHSGEEKEKQVRRTETPIVSGGSFMANSGRSEWWQQPSGNTESVGRGAYEKTQWSTHSGSLGGSGEGAEAVADTTGIISNGGGRGDHSKEREIQWETGRESSFLANSTASGSQASPEECGNTSKEQETVAASSRSGSGGTENVADSISRNVETGRERQREIRKGHQGEGTSDNVACGSEVEKSKNVADTCGTGLSSASSSRSDEESGEESRNEFPAGCGSALDWGDISGNWTVEPNVGRVAHGVPDRIHRIKALGNAVVPQLTYVIGMSIIKAMQDD